VGFLEAPFLASLLCFYVASNYLGYGTTIYALDCLFKEPDLNKLFYLWWDPPSAPSKLLPSSLFMLFYYLLSFPSFLPSINSRRLSLWL